MVKVWLLCFCCFCCSAAALGDAGRFRLLIAVWTRALTYGGSVVGQKRGVGQSSLAKTEIACRKLEWVAIINDRAAGCVAAAELGVPPFRCHVAYGMRSTLNAARG